MSRMSMQHRDFPLVFRYFFQMKERQLESSPINFLILYKQRWKSRQRKNICMRRGIKLHETKRKNNCFIVCTQKRYEIVCWTMYVRKKRIQTNGCVSIRAIGPTCWDYNYIYMNNICFRGGLNSIWLENLARYRIDHRPWFAQLALINMLHVESQGRGSHRWKILHFGNTILLYIYHFLQSTKT